ncbi:hypothetical protein FHR70_003497 [Microvirga lupini]|uniref:Uncharacterized protein n=1 Tax=Microvirga lupini TaxID=420324 RepID=A0A7W4VP28_9HYPH|nr:hypothetical protein [Microvirga lupini]MBB3020416.1 hypothetical protein [Microvirga lupini]
MLNAILHGKGRTLPDDVKPGASLKSTFKRSEDLLTATIFERLSYLDGEIIWQLLRKTFKPDLLPNRRLASLEEIEFWPLWTKANSRLKKDVEPDVVLRFAVGDPARTVTLIIESKLDGVQYPDQWAQQWIAHDEEYSGEDGPDECYFLALGGLRGSAEMTVSTFSERIAEQHGISVQAAAADWSDLMTALDEVDIERRDVRRIVTDLQEALALHGYRRVRPLAELPSCSDRLRGNFERSAAQLRSWAVSDSEPVPMTDLGDLAGWAATTMRFRPILSDGRVLRKLEL